jgi:hypothetical protein
LEFFHFALLASRGGLAQILECQLMAPMFRAMRKWVDQIHVNVSSLAERDGKRVVVKRRRTGAGLVMRLANAFFRLAKNPVEALADRSAWRDWEVDCFRRLHGPDFSAGADANGGAWIEVLPGQSLGDQLKRGSLRGEMLHAAGVELRRAHRENCPHYGTWWSHGDPHSGNFIFDQESGRARLIDFEVRHLRAISAADRHADDVLVLLQDVCGRCPADAWRSLAAALIEGYADANVTSRLREKVRVPGGFPRLWWAVRTTWMRRQELERRMSELVTLLPV